MGMYTLTVLSLEDDTRRVIAYDTITGALTDLHEWITDGYEVTAVVCNDSGMTAVVSRDTGDDEDEEGDAQ